MSPEYEPSSLMRRDEVCVPLGFGLHKNVDYDYLPSWLFLLRPLHARGAGSQITAQAMDLLYQGLLLLYMF